MARSGDIVFKWEQFKPLIKKKIQMIAAEFNDAHPCNPNLNQPNVKPFEFEEVKRNILNGIDSFTGAPFTIQRICELLTNPYKHYKRADKFLKGLEKNVMVISEETVDQNKTENGNTSGSSSICLNATFTMPSTSDSIGNNQSTAFHNGFKDSQSDDQILPHQQLDSFTSVFVSSAQTTSHLERIASLQILEQSTTVATTLTSSPHRPSHLSAIQPFLATTSVTRIPLISDPALDSLEKITQEIPIIEQPEQQLPLVADVIIQTVNSEETAALISINMGGEQIVQEEENKCLEREPVSDKTADGQVASEEAVVAAELNELQSLSDKNVLIGDANSESQKEESETPVKDQSTGNDLKRMHEDDEVESSDESFKRFKSDESLAEDEKAGEESAEHESINRSNDSINEPEQQLDDEKKESPKVDQEPWSEEQPVNEQGEEKTDQPSEVAVESQLEPAVSSDEPAEPPTEPSKESGKELNIDESGDKLNELKPDTDLKENDSSQEKEN